MPCGQRAVVLISLTDASRRVADAAITKKALATEGLFA